MPSSPTPDHGLMFSQWFRQVVALGVKYGYQAHNFSPEDWKDFYDNGYSPEDAMMENENDAFDGELVNS